jgi:hypothetical protein
MAGPADHWPPTVGAFWFPLLARILAAILGHKHRRATRGRSRRAAGREGWAQRWATAAAHRQGLTAAARAVLSHNAVSRCAVVSRRSDSVPRQPSVADHHIPQKCNHAASRLRLRAGQQGPRHARPAGLSRPQEYPTHRALLGHGLVRHHQRHHVRYRRRASGRRGQGDRELVVHTAASRTQSALEEWLRAPSAMWRQ